MRKTFRLKTKFAKAHKSKASAHIGENQGDEEITVSTNIEHLGICQ